MLNKIEAVTPRGDLLVLPLDNSDTGFLIQGEPGGLGPVKAEIVSSGFAGLDGSDYQSSQRGERNITFQVALVPDWAQGEDVSDLRDRIYDFFMTKRVVGLRFFDTKKNPKYISGRVESCEPSIFTDEPSVDVSIICNDPDFYDPTKLVIHDNSTAIESLEVSFDYPGTVEVGANFKLHVNRTMSAFTINHRTPDGLRIMEFAEDLLAGDVVEINTVRGNKYVRHTRGDTTTFMLYAISPQSNWIEIQPGLNYFQVFAPGASMPYDLECILKYGGL